MFINILHGNGEIWGLHIALAFMMALGGVFSSMDFEIDILLIAVACDVHEMESLDALDIPNFRK